ncbi:MAG: ABC transporter substrate-binding protein [Verrucomicrobiota bacterium]
MRSIFLCCALVVLASLLGCKGKEQAKAVPDTFVFARGSDAQKLDPADVDDGESVNTLAQICEGLVRFKPGTLEVEPWLAETFFMSADGLTYTFKIRKGITFHDGTPLDAEAAAFSFERQIDEAHPAHLPTASFQYWNFLYSEVKSVEVVDEMTLKLHLSQPNATLLYSLAIFPAWLISPNTPPAEIPMRPVGTGPYQFVEWAPDQAVVLERNENYWAYRPFYPRIIISTVPDNTVRVLMLKSGSVDAIDGVQPAEAIAYAENPAFTLHRAPSMNVGYLAIQSGVERLRDPEIRRALAMAINRQAIADLALDGAALPASYPIPPGFLGEPKSQAEPVPFDPEAAKKLLEAHLDLFDVPIVISTFDAPRVYFPDPQRVASLIRNDWEEIGLTVEIETRDFKSHLQTLRNGDFEVGLIGWYGDNGDTDNFLSTFFHSRAAVPGSATNFSFYKDPAMDAALDAARRVEDPETREKFYNQALKLWERDLPIIPLVHAEQLVLTKSQIKGFQLSPTGTLFWGPVSWQNE